eukprot:2259328-Alexandrium_andersonii.AAC.1
MARVWRNRAPPHRGDASSIPELPPDSACAGRISEERRSHHGLSGARSDQGRNVAAQAHHR